MTKVLVIGLDGATMDLVKPWIQQGKLPVLAQMCQNGTSGRLGSVMPVLSSAAWSSFMTGMNPGKHGIYDFVRREPGSYRLRIMRHDHNQGISIWKRLSDQGFKVGVMNVPLTYPPEELNGWIVTGLGTPDYKAFTYPSELGKELLQRGYRVNKSVAYHPGNEDAYLSEVNEFADQQLKNALWLMSEREWDFFMVVFFDTDQLAHYFWRFMDPAGAGQPAPQDNKYHDAILHYYQKMDASIGRLAQAAGEDAAILVLSDHGAGPLRKDVFLNEWLREQGYLATISAEPGLKGSHRIFATAGLTRSNISTLLRRTGLGRVERWIKDLFGDRIDLLPTNQRAEFPQAVDWTLTKAYSFGYQGQIYINLRGREPGGIVEPGPEYEQLCAEITARLYALVDPEDGKPVVDRVIRREELFHGPYTEYAPDLTLVMRGLSYITRKGFEFGEEVGKIFHTPITHESGSHRPDGLLIACGPGINKNGLEKEDANLIDLAPTILHLFGCPVPADMDGKVLQDWLVVSRPVQIDSSPKGTGRSGEKPPLISEEEEHEMVERLKGLGYLE